MIFMQVLITDILPVKYLYSLGIMDILQEMVDILQEVVNLVRVYYIIFAQNL